jgi:hypothetical protein
MSAGKGDKWRSTNFQNYWTNFPVVSGDSIPKKSVKIIKKKGKTRYIYK